MTAFELRAKEGPPGTRETVTVSPGLEITLVYGADRRVSTIEFPGVGPEGTRESLDQALLDLIPLSVRGKELGRGVKKIGSFSLHHTYYELMMVSERDMPSPPYDRESIIVSFRISHQSSSTS